MVSILFLLSLTGTFWCNIHWVDGRETDTCDYDNVPLKKLCRKVESQEHYLEKMVDNLYKTETVFRWYSANKDWLHHQRLGRMMKRLLKRAVSINPTEPEDSIVDPKHLLPEEQIVNHPTVNVTELERKFNEMSEKMMTMEKMLNQSQVQIGLFKKDQQQWMSQKEANKFQNQINETWIKYQKWFESGFLQMNISLENVSKSQRNNVTERLTLLEDLLHELKNSPTQCSCLNNSQFSSLANSFNGSRQREEENQDDLSDRKLTSVDEELKRMRKDFQSDIQSLQEKLRLASDDLTKAMSVIQISNEATLRNLSQTYQDGFKSTMMLLEDRLSENGKSAYDIILNTTLAFGEDLIVIRHLVSNSTSDVQYLMSQDFKAQRIFEDLKSSSRRHEGNIQTIVNQLAEFKNLVQDQLTSIRNNLMQTVLEFYNKVIERQNQMSYRMTYIVNDLTSIKGKVRNLISPSSSTKEDEEDAIPSLPPFEA